MVNILSSALVTAMGVLFFHVLFGDNMDMIVIGSIVPLLPGVPLTNSIRDFLYGDYLSGTIRMIDAVLGSLLYCAGSRYCAQRLSDAHRHHIAVKGEGRMLSLLAQTAVSFVATVSFAILFQVRGSSMSIRDCAAQPAGCAICW